jgi:hypothetical protein
MLLTLLIMSACQLGSVVAPTLPPTNLPSADTSVPPAPTTTPSPVVHPQASADAIRIQFEDTTMLYSPGDLEPNAAIQSVFSALTGQQISVNLSTDPTGGAALSIWGADGTVLIPETVGITSWNGVLPSSQNYYISIRSTSSQRINYELTLKLPPLTPPDATRVQFQPNTTSWYTPGDLAPNTKIRFVLGALAGQQMTVNLTTVPPENAACLYIWGADGTVYTLMDPTLTWSGILPASQDYYIEVRSISGQSINYQLNVEIPAVGSAPASAGLPKIAKDQPIRFAMGPLDVALNGTVISGERDRYTLSMRAGEILDVLITSLEGNAVFTILGPDHVALPGTEEGKDTIQWAVPIPADGSYAILVGPTRGNATYTLKVNVSGLP